VSPYAGGNWDIALLFVVASSLDFKCK
jgi:hypothetical protein